MKSRPHKYAIIAAILIILILAGSIFYYYTTIRKDGPPVTYDSNLFGTSSKQGGTSNPTYGSNSFTRPYVDGIAPASSSPAQPVRVVTRPTYTTFSQPYSTYRAPSEPQSTPFVPAGVPETQVPRSTPTSATREPEPTYTYTYVYDRSTGSSTPVRVTTRRPRNQDEDESAINQFAELDQQVFGYVTGLGWTQYLGTIGQAAFDGIYAFTPQGSTNNTLGGLLGGFGGGGGGGFGGGAFGGGGGGVQQNFGGKITRITYCTCQSSSMLDISDVRGQAISLIFTPGASVLYEHYNVHTPGVTVLGNYTPGGGQCLVYHGEECSAEGSPQGNITSIGTTATAAAE